jgi:hypothetical protein
MRRTGQRLHVLRVERMWRAGRAIFLIFQDFQSSKFEIQNSELSCVQNSPNCA